MRGTRVLVGTIVAAAALAACTGQPESPSASLSVGSAGATYALSAVDGQRLPAIAYFGVDVSVAATGGSLALAPDRTYTLNLAYNRHFASGNRDVPFTQAEQGSWSLAGTELTLVPSGGTPHKATVAGNELTMVLTLADASPPERATKTYAFTKTQ